jgi:hypothetical protein
MAGALCDETRRAPGPRASVDIPLLYGVGPRDGTTMLAAAGALAAFLPAWRAVRVDPIAALRGE